ncbi:MAG: response regulator [Desulfobacteraceae bacterium]|nr:response regulator [Desulfobacteraceae bacterium]
MARIMVVDDVEDAALVVRRILEKKGHVVAAFTDEDEALRHAAAEEIDLAVLDVKLRKLEGIDVLAELKKLRPAVKVILLTGYPTPEGERRARTLGVAAYCVKPIDKQELEEKVEEALGGVGVN